MYRIVAYLLFIILLLTPIAGRTAWTERPTGQSSPQLQLQQKPGQPQNAATTEDIHDIKGPLPLSETNHFLIFGLGILALLIIVALLFIFLKRLRQPQPVTSTPDVIALSELDQARILMTVDQALAYADRLSNILRQYIENRFRIRSTRQTTQEFFSGLQSGATIAEVDIKNHAQDLQGCLEQCDMAKFAHDAPNPDSMMQMDLAVRTFIEITRPIDTYKGKP
jgi:hypothetical protein